jgi:hypothetical protein
MMTVPRKIGNSLEGVTYNRVGHEKVVRLPFCKYPYDILSGVSMYIV